MSVRRSFIYVVHHYTQETSSVRYSLFEKEEEEERRGRQHPIALFGIFGKEDSIRPTIIENRTATVLLSLHQRSNNSTTPRARGLVV